MSLHVVVTGASAGIGAACARAFRSLGHRLSLGARRADRLDSVVSDAFRSPLDVTRQDSIEAFLEGAVLANGPVDVLVNNAGLARGIERLAEADGRAWREMVETNLLGLLEVTRRVLPSMIERRKGHVIVIGSVAGRRAYPGGSVYCATKRALQSICEAMRMEVLGTSVRVTSVDPGLVETEFSLVRFSGDAERAANVYRDMRPLRAEDVADCVVFAATRPAHVNIDSILVMPTDQAAPSMVHRGGR
ncbi:MAG: SDR family NAD(P)-dependent oxidoreductase [Planctomycetota bacterium]